MDATLLQTPVINRGNGDSSLPPWMKPTLSGNSPCRAQSSAQARGGQRQDTVLITKTSWCRQIEGIDDWSAWLAQGDEPEALEILRRNAD